MNTNTSPTATPIDKKAIQEHLDHTLRQFCKNEVWNDEFQFQLTPFRCKDLCVATDGHVLLAIEQSAFPTKPTYSEHDTPLVQHIYDMMGESEDFDTYAVDDIETLCDECEKLNDKAKDETKNVIYLAPDAISVRIMRRVSLAARLLGASSIIVASPKKAQQMRFFSLCNADGVGSVAFGIFMPLAYDEKYHVHSLAQTIFAPDTANIDLEAGMKYRTTIEAIAEQQRREYEASKKVWNVSVMKIAYVAVEAVTEEQARKMVEHNLPDDDVFEDSDICQGPYCGELMDDDEVKECGTSEQYRYQGILTDDDWQNWKDYYQSHDIEATAYDVETRTRVTVSLSKGAKE